MNIQTLFVVGVDTCKGVDRYIFTFLWVLLVICRWPCAWSWVRWTGLFNRLYLGPLWAQHRPIISLTWLERRGTDDYWGSWREVLEGDEAFTEIHVWRYDAWRGIDTIAQRVSVTLYWWMCIISTVWQPWSGFSHCPLVDKFRTWAQQAINNVMCCN